MEEVYSCESVGHQDKLGADAELVELELHRFLIDVVTIDIQNLTTLAVHMEVFFISEGPSIRAKVNQLLYAYHLLPSRINLLCILCLIPLDECLLGLLEFLCIVLHY